jgi:hypothetical protein
MCHLQELYAKYHPKGLVILGLNVSDDKKIAQDMLRSSGVTFPNILDDSPAAIKASFEDYRNGVCPTNYVIDREGKIVRGWGGYEEGHPEAKMAMKQAGGPLADAIQQDWDAAVQQSAAAVTAAARRLFEAIRTADYGRDWTKTGDWKWFPSRGVNYNGSRDREGWVRWVCRKFKTNPIADVRLGKVVAGSRGMPTIHCEVRLQSGEVLQGDVPFESHARGKRWTAQGGIDWHLPATAGKETKKP